jgi:hypothetical protein
MKSAIYLNVSRFYSWLMVVLIAVCDSKPLTDSLLDKAASSGDEKKWQGTNESKDNGTQLTQLLREKSVVERRSLTPRKETTLGDIKNSVLGAVEFGDMNRGSMQPESVDFVVVVESGKVTHPDMNGASQNIAVKGTLHVLHKIQSLFSRRKVNKGRNMTI